MEKKLDLNRFVATNEHTVIVPMWLLWYLCQCGFYGTCA